MTKAFSKLEKAQNVLNGRQADTAIEPIIEPLYNLLLNYKLLRSKLTDLNQLVANLIKPERAMETHFLL